MRAKPILPIFMCLLLAVPAFAGEAEVPWPGVDGDAPPAIALLPGACDVVAVAGGRAHGLALKADGSVWAWGYNGNGELGDGTTAESHTPVQVHGAGNLGFLTGVTAIAAGAIHSLALKGDGTVWAWGYNTAGQLGDGTTTQRNTPVQVSGLTGVRAIAGALHSLALKSDGTVWAWGYNNAGELGDGTVTNRLNPVQVSGLTGITAIAAGQTHSLAVKSDGTLWAWGSNANGELGDGTYTQRNTPVQVSGLTDISAIAGGGYHSVALKSDGTVWSWGMNARGELGDGTTTWRNTPGQLSRLTGATAVAAASNGHSLALKSDGTIWAWGYNGFGQLGDGTVTDRLAPVQVSGLTGVAAIATGAKGSVALRNDGTVWAWGDNWAGQLGDGSTTNRLTPIQTLMPCDPCAVAVIAITGGAYHSLALKSDGTVWSWGSNETGQLGDGSTTDRLSPMQVSGLAGVIAISGGARHSLAVKSDGTLWAWGNNAYGQLGDGTGTDRLAPVQVSALTGIIAVAGGTYHNLALKSDGSVWAWGYNAWGQLGDGTTTNRSFPVQVIGLTRGIAVATGERHSLALESDGSVWGFGYNSNGQLGDGTTIARDTPVQVSGLTDISAIAAGYLHSLALKSDGTIQAWGWNSYGQLGDGTTSERVTPVPVSGLTGVTAISARVYHSLALRSDGTVWSWGDNTYGQIGDGTTTQRLTPVQVISLTGARMIAGGAFHSLSVKSDGSLWSWGHDGYGQLGDGTTTERHTPIQVAFGGGGSPIVLTCPSATTRECPGNTAPSSTGQPTTSGGCGVTTTSFVDTVAFGCGGTRVISRRFTAADGLTSTSCVQVISVVDTTAPMFSLRPGNVTVECDALPSAPTITAIDTCDNGPVVNMIETSAPGSCANRYTLTRTWTATDACGNAASHAQVILVRDTTAPAVTRGAIGACYPTVAAAEAAAIAATTATDNCVGVITKAAATIGTCTATVMVAAVDACGNSASVTYSTRIDGSAPSISAPPPLTLECNSAGGVLATDPVLQAWLASATALDNCDGPLAVSNNTPALLPSGCAPGMTTTITFLSQDTCGNIGHATSTITVVDTTPPIITPGSDVLGCLWPPNHRMHCFTTALFTPQINDLCDSQPLSWSFAGCAADQPDNALGDGNTVDDCQVAPDGQSFCVRSERQGMLLGGRTYAVSIVASDACGNTSAAVTIGAIHVPHDVREAKDCKGR